MDVTIPEQRQIRNAELERLRRVPLEIRTTRLSLQAALDDLASLADTTPDERRRLARAWCRKARRALDEAALATRRSREALDASVAQAEAHAAQLRAQTDAALAEIASTLDEAEQLVRSLDEVA